MDEFTKAIMEKASARNEATKQKMLDQQRRRRLGPLNSRGNLVQSSTNQSTSEIHQDVGGKAKPIMSERLKRIVAQRKQWDAEERGEEINLNEVPTPTKHEDPRVNSPVILANLNPDRKAKLAHLARRYTNDDDSDIFASTSYVGNSLNKSPTNSDVNMADCKEKESASSAIKNTADGDCESSNLEMKKPSPILNQDRTKRRSDVQQPVPAKRKSFGADSILKKGDGNYAVGTSTPKDDIVRPNSGNQRQHMISVQDSSLSSQQQMPNNEESYIHDNSSAMSDAPPSTSVGGMSFGESDLDEDYEINSVEQESLRSDQDLAGESVDGSYLDGSDEKLGNHHQDSTVGNTSNMTSANEDEEGDEFSFGDEDDNVEDGTDENFDTVIDELFSFGNDSVCSSALPNSDVTVSKSRRQICDELNDRRQVFNEAEDTRTILTRRVSRREMLSPPRRLVRSNSTESILPVSRNQSFRDELNESGSNLLKTSSVSTPTTSKSTNNDSSIPLFTIDSYRSDKRNQTKNSSTRTPVIAQTSSKITKNTAKKPTSNYKLQVQKPYKEKKKELEGLIQQQLSFIKQASDAVNCCYDVKHGKGTRAELEAEKFLLLSRKKHLALRDELKDLEKKGPRGYGLQAPTSQTCRASITINQISLPMRSEHLFAMNSNAVNTTPHYIILVNAGGGKVLETDLTAAPEDIIGDQLRFKRIFTFENLSSDFEIEVEVYTAKHFRAQPQATHQDKSNKSKGFFNKKTGTVSLRSLTPRKFRSRNMSSSSSLSCPSPGGPNAVRTSSFTLIGSCTITKSDMKDKSFELANVPFLSPITGRLRCEIKAEFHSMVEQCGFLTMFDDVGGLGAWHRRWCALYNGVLSAWEYPTDVNLKRPQRQIPLQQCISPLVKPVERINCARPNVFEFRTMRERRKDDKDNLISFKTGSVITIKHWIAADSKAERDGWIDVMNQALTDVREWNSEALKPITS